MRSAIVVFVLLLANFANLEAATASWDRNPEPDVTGYILSWGTQSRTYTTNVDVGNVTTYQINNLSAGRYYFAVRAYNSSSQTSQYSVEVVFDIVNGGNTPPTLSQPANQTSPENSAAALQLSATDPDGNALAYSVTGLPPGLSLNTSTGLISGTLSFTSAGSYTVTATVSDGIATNSKTFTWTVSNVNRAPSLSQPANQTSVLNSSVSLLLSATDPDGTTLSYSATGLPPSLTIDASSGQISGAATTPGTYTVTTTVSDGALSDSKTFTWTVTASTVRARVPTRSDFDGDGKADVVTYRPSSGRWWILKSNANYTTGQVLDGISTTQAAPGDYDGDGKADVASFNPSTGVWSIQQSSGGSQPVLTITLGSSAESIVPADYDGDGKSDIATFRASTGLWSILQSTSNFSTQTTYTLGAPGDIPIAGDYDGDGKADVAIYRPSTGAWTIRRSSTGTTVGYTLGIAGDVPAPGDFDGDGKVDLAVARHSAGTWHILRSTTNYQTPLVVTSGGEATDIAMAGDYDGDGRADVARYRPSTGGWTVMTSSSNYTQKLSLPLWGDPTDVPVAMASVASTGSGGTANQPPTLTSPGAQTTTQNTSVSMQLVASDPDGNTLTYTATSLPPALTINASTGLISGTATTVGTFNVTAAVSDGIATSSQTFSWTVTAASSGNRAPVLQQPANQSTIQNSSASLQLSGSDPDGNVLTYSAAALPPGLTIASSSGLISGTATTAGNYTVTATASDGSLSNSKTFTWTVTAATARPPVPTRSDFDGDGKADVVTYRPSSGTWWVLKSNANYTTGWMLDGLPNTQPAPGDYDGDKKADAAGFNPATGVWSIQLSGAPSQTPLSITWGSSSETIVPADYDGDGKSDIATFRASTGLWSILQSTSNFSTQVTYTLGTSGDIPVSGDYDGDGKADAAIYRPSTGTWTILRSSSGTTVGYTLGVAGDVPVPCDFDGDGKIDIAVARQSAGTWHILRSTTNYQTPLVVTVGGQPTDVAMAGDYDGDGKADVVRYRPSTGGWTVLTSSSNYTQTLSLPPWGDPADVPVAMASVKP